MNSNQQTKTRKRIDPGKIAENMPAPKPGMSFKIDLEPLCIYARIHNLKLSFRGDLVIATPMPKEEEKEGNNEK